MPYYVIEEGKKTLGYLTPAMHRKAKTLEKLQGVTVSEIDPSVIPKNHVEKYFKSEKPWEKDL